MDAPLPPADRRARPPRRPPATCPPVPPRRPGWKDSTSPTTTGNSPATRSPSWNRRASRSAARTPWPAGYQALLAFKAEHGHLRVPDRYKTADGFTLSDWQRDQRVRRKADRLTGEQVALLEEAGFCWDPLAEAWHARYQEAVAWRQEHGNLDLPRKHPLKEWLSRQQKNHRQGRLPADRARLLRELGVLTTSGPDEETPGRGKNSSAISSPLKPQRRKKKHDFHYSRSLLHGAGVFPCFPVSLAIAGIRETLSRYPARAVHFQ